MCGEIRLEADRLLKEGKDWEAAREVCRIKNGKELKRRCGRK